MLDLHDRRWAAMVGSYQSLFDPRPLFSELERCPHSDDAWERLFDGLCHDGLVGEASYAAVTHLVCVNTSKDVVPLGLFTLAASVELARTTVGTPQPPAWLQSDYIHAIEELSLKGMQSLKEQISRGQISSILPLLYIWKGFRVYAAALIEYSEAELSEFFVAEDSCERV